MSRDTRYTYQYQIRCDVTRLNLPGHVIVVGTPAIRHIHVTIVTRFSASLSIFLVSIIPSAILAYSLSCDRRCDVIVAGVSATLSNTPVSCSPVCLTCDES